MKIALTVHSTTEPTQEVIDFLTSKGDVKYVIRNEAEGNYKEFIIDKDGNRFDLNISNNGENYFEAINGSNLSVFDYVVRYWKPYYKGTLQEFYDTWEITSINHDDVLDGIINNFNNGSVYADIYQQSTIAMNDFVGQTDEFIVKYLLCI